jgi:hypothetical protein
MGSRSRVKGPCGVTQATLPHPLRSHSLTSPLRSVSLINSVLVFIPTILVSTLLKLEAGLVFVCANVFRIFSSSIRGCELGTRSGCERARDFFCSGIDTFTTGIYPAVSPSRALRSIWHPSRTVPSRRGETSTSYWRQTPASNQ